MLVLTAGDKNINKVFFHSINIINHDAFLINTLFFLYQVNQIRDSLAIMGDNSTAFSLPQVWVCLVAINIFLSIVLIKLSWLWIKIFQHSLERRKRLIRCYDMYRTLNIFPSDHIPDVCFGINNYPDSFLWNFCFNYNAKWRKVDTSAQLTQICHLSFCCVQFYWVDRQTITYCENIE